MATYEGINDRQGKAMEYIAKKGFVSLSELGEFLEVSESTARRDVEALVAKSQVARTHGGVICTQYRGGYRLAASERATSMAAEKQVIARNVAGLIDDGQSVIINGGSTCCYAAQLLSGKRLNLVTNCPEIASMLSTDIETEVTLLGGYVYPRTGVALGTTAENQLEGIRASVGILGCASVSQEGVFNANQIMVDMDRKIIQAAEKVILLADHSKFGVPGLIKQCDFDEIDMIVTDSGVDENWLRLLESLSTEIIVAS